jgi:alanyl-tRNA synthetase
MEGSIELEWKGKYITIERSSTPKAPMSVFRAFDTKSGRTIEVLTGENCGRILCGVERSVFERTAFIRQMGISISGDSALEKRLGAMVSTGEESAKSAQQLEKELQGLKNRLSGRAGKITKLQTELTETERLHSYVTKLREDMEAMEGRRKELEEETNRLEALLQRIDRAKDARGQIALQDLEKKLREQESLCINLEQLTGKLPTEATLHKLNKRLEAAQPDTRFFCSPWEKAGEYHCQALILKSVRAEAPELSPAARKVLQEWVAETGIRFWVGGLD